MKRVKSAPANLASMSHKKKNQPKMSISIVLPLLKQNNELPYKKYNKINTNKINTNKINTNKINNIDIISLFYRKKTTLIKSEKINIIKNVKKISNKTGNIICDAFGDMNLLSLEESSIINALIIYFSENVTTKDKLKDIYVYLLQFIIRYFILLFIHSNILHDKYSKILPSSDDLNIIKDNIHSLM
jgi:hypothetical protein